MIVVMLEGDNGERRGVKLVSGSPLPDPEDDRFALLTVEWWGGPDDGEEGLVRLSAEDAIAIGHLATETEHR
jgi:hypothetical protein